MIYIPKKGDIFKWCEEEYICIESTDFSGVVNPKGESYYLRGFIWNYGNELQEFVRELTQKEYNNIFEKL